MKKFITEIILVGNHEKNPEIFSEGAIRISVRDDGGGRFLEIEDAVGEEPHIKLDFNELDEFFAACRELQQ